MEAIDLGMNGETVSERLSGREAELTAGGRE